MVETSEVSPPMINWKKINKLQKREIRLLYNVPNRHPTQHISPGALAQNTPKGGTN